MSKPQPVAECTKCGKSTTEVHLINQNCNFVYPKKGKCKGTYRSMIGADDWKKCPNCSESDTKCSTCFRAGYVSNR